MNKRIGLRIDVDTGVGFSRGVPVILNLLEKYQTRGTFFIVAGFESPVRSLRRSLYEQDFLRRVVSLSGGFLKGGLPKRSTSVRRGMKELVADEHEIGLHGYHHFDWQIHVGNWSKERVKRELERGVEKFSYLVGSLPRSFAAPGWVTKEEVFLCEEEYRFDYCSDTRGVSPFYPRFGTQKMKTLQIPVTVPTLDEMVFLGNPEGLLDLELKNGDVYCAHAEFEGIGFSELFEMFLRKNLDEGIRFVPLNEIRKSLGDVSESVIEYRNVPGRTNLVSFQVSKSLC